MWFFLKKQKPQKLCKFDLSYRRSNKKKQRFIRKYRSEKEQKYQSSLAGTRIFKEISNIMK